MDKNYLGSNLRRIRKLLERKQEDISACVGISTRQYRKMENDEVPIKQKYLIKLADCYGISVDDILDFSASNLTTISKGKRSIELSFPILSLVEKKETKQYYENIILAKNEQ